MAVLEFQPDDDPPPRNSPRLLGDRIGQLTRYRRTAELRSGSPEGSCGHRFLRDAMVAVLVKAGFTQKAVAHFAGLSRPTVSDIVQKVELLVSRDVAGDDGDDS